MEIKDILDENIIDLSIEAKNKDQVLRHLANLLKENGYIQNLEEFVSDIYLRESEGITGIGNGIAIPHGKSNEAKRIGIAIGKTNNFIEWESIDEKPVNIIFLFCVSNDVEYARNHLMLLAKIAGKLGNDNTIKKLLNSTSKKEIIDIFSE